MENVKAIVSHNLLRLRKENNLTQAELAKKISYSDKAISRWESGEVVPDLETIYALSEVFNVPVSQITETHTEEREEEKLKSGIGQKVLSQIFLCCEIWFILTALYVYLKLSYQTNVWQLFVWSVPACMMVLWLFNRKDNLNICCSFIPRSLCGHLLPAYTFTWPSLIPGTSTLSGFRLRGCLLYATSLTTSRI